MPTFNFFYDSNKKNSANIFGCVQAVGQLCADGLTTLQKLQEAINGTMGSTSGNNLSSAGYAIRESLVQLTEAIKTVGKETLTSEVVQRVREDNIRLEGVIAGLKKEIELAKAPSP